jgi:hypothetical protein
VKRETENGRPETGNRKQKTGDRREETNQPIQLGMEIEYFPQG